MTRWRLAQCRPLLLPLLLPLLALGLPRAAAANDFPTADRVEYVLECMMNHPGKQEYLYKCACTIDRIAEAIAYDEYVEIATAARHQGMSGQRGAEFRDPDSVKAMAGKFKAVQEQARKDCYVQ